MTGITNERCREILSDMTAWINKNAFDSDDAFKEIGLTADEVSVLRKAAAESAQQKEDLARLHIANLLAKDD